MIARVPPATPPMIMAVLLLLEVEVAPVAEAALGVIKLVCVTKCVDVTKDEGWSRLN